jgi:hypothetical protein
MPVSQSWIDVNKQSSGAINRLLAHLANQGQAKAAPAEPKAPSTGEVAAGELEEISATGVKETKEREQALADEAKGFGETVEADKAAAEGVFDQADRTADEMARRVQHATEGARKSIEGMPEAVKGVFKENQAKLDKVLGAGREGLAEQRTDALGRVMEGQTMAMQAAVHGFQSELRTQNAQIDRMVVTGDLSPSQAQMMKMQGGMKAAMDIAPAIGQTIGMFRQIEAGVATSFGNMFAQMESVGAQTTAQLGAAAGTAFTQAETARGNFNTQLAGIEAQAETQRAALYSTNAANRAQAVATFDTIGLEVMDFRAARYAAMTDADLNRFTHRQDIASMMIKSEQMEEYMEMMKEHQDAAQQNASLNMLFSVGQLVAGMF